MSTTWTSSPVLPVATTDPEPEVMEVSNDVSKSGIATGAATGTACALRDEDEDAFYDDADDDVYKDLDNPDNYAHIDGSLAYFVLKKQLEQANALVEEVLEFEKTMPPAKRPSNGSKGGRLTVFKDKAKKIEAKIKTFRFKYAQKRVEARNKREARIARDKRAKSHDDCLGKPLTDQFAKRLKIVKIVASRSAAAAIRALPTEVSQEERDAAAKKAFNEQVALLMKSDAILPDMDSLAAEAGSDDEASEAGQHEAVSTA